jgi:hypothetical protein
MRKGTPIARLDRGHRLKILGNPQTIIIYRLRISKSTGFSADNPIKHLFSRRRPGKEWREASATHFLEIIEDLNYLRQVRRAS